MKSVFISGSISIKRLPHEVIKSFDKIIVQNIPVYVGDANGIDVLTQDYFASKNYTNLKVCTIYETPRNQASRLFEIKQVNHDVSIVSEREKQTAKDVYMTQHSDYSFVIWDGKSKGSYANITRAMESQKKLKVYYLQENRCLSISELESKNIEMLYKSNIGYTASEIVNKIKSSNLYIGISKVSELKEWLVSHRVFKVNQTKVEINKEYKNYFIVENYRGKETVKYKYDVIDLLKKSTIFGVGQ
ncbi:hypothetical protein [Sulfurovum sp.]|uniref:hypothetical protein n=1 Tax=Sulfurovum sp. TaxID=1969726 RepID=UPI00286831C1|nr:hypothetical protein [Sulfurovum sp.]